MERAPVQSRKGNSDCDFGNEINVKQHLQWSRLFRPASGASSAAVTSIAGVPLGDFSSWRPAGPFAVGHIEAFAAASIKRKLPRRGKPERVMIEEEGNGGKE
jgi:hypothetical protein